MSRDGNDVTFLRIHCPHSEECGRTRHWTLSGWRGCLELDDAATVRRYEQEEAAREIAAWECVFAAAGHQHHQEEPTSEGERSLRDNGERQLLQLTPAQLLVLGQLGGSGVARVNRALRSGVGLDQACAADLDWAGYRSNADFAAAATQVFTALGAALELPETVTVYRGMLVDPDTSIAALLRSLPVGGVFEEPGFTFTAATPGEACYYTTEDAWWGDAARVPAAYPVILELGVSLGVCIPHPEHRSPELVTYLAQTRQVSPACFTAPADQHPTSLERACGQLIVPPGSRWKVVGRSSPQTLAFSQIPT